MAKVITILIDINIDVAEPLLPLRKYRYLLYEKTS